MTTDFKQLIPVLAKGNVRFIIVGGVAATIHGSARATFDLDVVYDREPGNIERLVRALQPHKPYLRGAPEGLPFVLSSETVSKGLNFTLTTALGNLDLLGELTGGGSYNELLPHAQEIEVFGVRCQCLSLQRLIEVKRAAGRPRDLDAIAELEAIMEEIRKREK